MINARMTPAMLASIADRKSTRLNSSHEWISYAVFCLKKKNRKNTDSRAKGAESDKHRHLSESPDRQFFSGTSTLRRAPRSAARGRGHRQAKPPPALAH